MPRMGGYVPADHKTRHQDGGRDEVSIADLAGESVNLAAHKLVLDAHTFNWMALIRTGAYLPPFTYYPSSNVALVADTIYAIPFIVARAMTIGSLTIRVITGVAGKIARLGIYRNGTNNYPGVLLKDYNTVSVAAAAIVTATFAQALTKGLYWLVVVSDSTPTLSWIHLLFNPLGSSIGCNVDALYAGWSKAAVGSGALANPFVSDADLFTVKCPCILPSLTSLD